MTAKGILVVVDDPGWRKFRGLVPQLERAATAAAKAARLRGSVTILLSNDRKLRALNREFRRKDKATNVLSFPVTPNHDRYRGDVALALGVTRREAKTSNKRFADHAAHLAVHGMLHLAGYDHVRASDAKVMEALEIKILRRLGIANPYEAVG
jgi:probable rRNA maturation factor